MINELISVIRGGNNEDSNRFREKYRACDVLMIDDIQFLSGKRRRRKRSSTSSTTFISPTNKSSSRRTVRPRICPLSKTVSARAFPGGFRWTSSHPIWKRASPSSK